MFPDAALKLYGVYERQTLKKVFRGGDLAAQGTVVATIRRRTGLAANGGDGTILSGYYYAVCVRLKGGLLVSRRRPDAFRTIGK